MLRGLDQKVKHWEKSKNSWKKINIERSETKSGKSRGHKMFCPGSSRDRKRTDELHSGQKSGTINNGKSD